MQRHRPPSFPRTKPQSPQIQLSSHCPFALLFLSFPTMFIRSGISIPSTLYTNPLSPIPYFHHSQPKHQISSYPHPPRFQRNIHSSRQSALSGVLYAPDIWSEISILNAHLSQDKYTGTSLSLGWLSWYTWHTRTTQIPEYYDVVPHVFPRVVSVLLEWYFFSDWLSYNANILWSPSKLL